VSASLRDRYLAALAAVGLKRDAHQPSRKYVTVAIAGGRRLYLGKSGAVRCGSTVTGSVAVSDLTKARLLEGAVPQHWVKP